MVREFALVYGIILIILVCSPVTAGSDDRAMTPGGLVRFIDEAAHYADSEGLDASLLEYNSTDGLFTRGDLYIYAYDMNGTLLAHPYVPEEIGKNRLMMKDIRGMEMIRFARDIATEGEGFLFYLYPAPESDAPIDEHDGAYIPKLGYAKSITEDVWIGSGLYLKDMTDPATGEPLLSDLITFVHSAAEYARSEGRDVALAAFNDPEGAFVDGSDYIFAIDMNGTALAQPFDPEIVGTTRMDLIRDYGVLSVYEAVQIARDESSGYLAYVMENPVTGRPESKLTYVEQVDEDWFVGSGRYASVITGASWTAEELVRKAADLIQNDGTDSFPIIRDPEGAFATGDMYVFVETPDGMVIVNGQFPELEGTNILDLTDENGRYFVQEYIEKTVQSGSAWTSYLWPKPGETESSVKYTYTMLAAHDGEEYIVGAGSYLD